jgi:hypothetical protein
VNRIGFKPFAFQSKSFQRVPRSLGTSGWLRHARQISGDYPNGIKFIGTKGWIFVTREENVTASDPGGPAGKPLEASDPKIIESVIGPHEIHLATAAEHHANWLDCVRSRQEPLAPAEIAHRACSTCLLHHIAMKLKRRLHWDPVKERFRNDDQANAMLSRPQRAPYGFHS